MWQKTVVGRIWRTVGRGRCRCGASSRRDELWDVLLQAVLDISPDERIILPLVHALSGMAIAWDGTLVRERGDADAAIGVAILGFGGSCMADLDVIDQLFVNDIGSSDNGRHIGIRYD